MKKILAILVATAAFSGTAALAQLPTQPYLFGEWQGTMTVAPNL